jgi:hypothetical protein
MNASKSGETETDEAFLARVKAMAAMQNDDKPSSSVIQLPLWSEPERAIPNTVLRSALFGVVRRGHRKFINGETLASWKDTSIRYKGEQLDQYDEDVWLQALHIARLQDLSDAHGIRFTSRSFLTAMGRQYSGAAAKALHASIERMIACAVSVKVEGFEYMGSLISECTVHEPTGRYVLRFNPRLKQLFDVGYTRLDWKTRRMLPTDLARWLHGYIQSHRATPTDPHRIGLSTLKKLSAVETSLRDFRWRIRREMSALQQAGVVIAWRLTEGDALEFVRPVRARRVGNSNDASGK